ncbi:MAG: Gfo/Idh/MocA family protein [Promethearchaeota archaeon]
MVSNEKLKVGVIGCGIVAKNGHLPWYYRSPLAEIAAVADPDAKRLKIVQKAFKVNKAYENPNDLLEDPEIDAVSICSPHWAHCEQVILAANNGKHVLCEKPIGINLSECDAMIKAVEKNKIIFQTATQKRFDPGFQMIKENLEEGKLGKVFHISVYWYHSIPDLEAKWIKRGLNIFKKLGIDNAKNQGAWRLTDKRSGGGDLLDHGPHYFDLFRWLFGEIFTITAQIRKVYESRVYEDHAALLISFRENDIIGVFERSENIVGRLNGKELGRIHGTKGSYYFSVPFEAELAPLTLEKYTWKNIIRDKPSKVKIQFPKDVWNCPYAREVRSFINQVLGRSNEDVGFPEEWIPTIQDGRASLEAVIAAYESAKKQETIKLPLK